MVAVIKISGDKRTKKKSSNFSPELRLETAQLVVLHVPPWQLFSFARRVTLLPIKPIIVMLAMEPRA